MTTLVGIALRGWSEHSWDLSHRKSSLFSLFSFLRHMSRLELPTKLKICTELDNMWLLLLTVLKPHQNDDAAEYFAFRKTFSRLAILWRFSTCTFYFKSTFKTWLLFTFTWVHFSGIPLFLLLLRWKQLTQIITFTHVHRPNTLYNIVNGWVLGLARKIDSDILPIPPLIFTQGQEVRNLAFETLCFRNEVTVM